MNIPYKNNKFINTLLLYIPTEKVKSFEYSNKKIYYKSKDRNMKITGNKLLVFIVNIRKRNLQTIFSILQYIILYFVWLTLFYGYKEVMINVNAFVIYNLWLSIIYVHPLTSYVHVCDVDVVDVEREFLLSPKNKREPSYY